jgi:photosystem II stability/assembly factor-like uncharacterized protein
MVRIFVGIALLAAATVACGQWTMQESRSDASLRGIHSVNASVAWASGTNGTILRTEDGGAHWQKCPVPPDAENLDFRGIWAWNANTAIVMSSGTGDLSRRYKTTDACAHWTEDATNSEKDGFWDALVFQTKDFGMLGDEHTGVLIGDPLRGRFYAEVMVLGHGWFIDNDSCAAQPGEGAFAASNSSVFVLGSRRYIIGTGGKSGPRVLISPLLAGNGPNKGCREVLVPLAKGNDSSGIFSLFFRDLKHGVAVGGDYKSPSNIVGTAAWTADGGLHWTASSTPPHGFRSSVAWFNEVQSWIAAGPNGSDVSYDDGTTWRPIDQGNWNALSPPFVVGPHGRIARLSTNALKH